MTNPKRLLRERMRGERRIAAEKRPDAARHAARNFMQAIPLPADDADNKYVSVYFPIQTELDTEPLAAALIEKNISVALPVTLKKKSPLIFRAYSPGDPLLTGSFGEKIPIESANIVSPAIVVLPLLAFNRRGDRLGYGGGFYDRTLAELRRDTSVLAVGYAFGAQEVDDIPTAPLDERLDWVVTEREAIRC